MKFNISEKRQYPSIKVNKDLKKNHIQNLNTSVNLSFMFQAGAISKV